eukprot:tig00020510_g9948.t1
MLAIRGAQLSHPVTKCSGIGSAPDPEDLWPDDPNELDVASLKAWDDMLLSWERHAPASNVWGLASDSSALPDSERLPLLSLLISSAYLLAQPGLKWPGIQHLQVEPNGDPRFDITPDGNVSRTVTGYHAMRTALAAARELLDEDSDFHAYCVQLVLAIIRFRTLTVLPGALGFEKGSLFAWISPKDVAPPLSLFQTYTERLTEVAGATCFDTRAKGTVPERVIAMQNSRRARCMAGEPPLVNLSELVQHGSDLEGFRAIKLLPRVAVRRLARILDLRRPTEFSSLLFSDWLMGLGTYHAAPRSW